MERSFMTEQRTQRGPAVRSRRRCWGEWATARRQSARSNTPKIARHGHAPVGYLRQQKIALS